MKPEITVRFTRRHRGLLYGAAVKTVAVTLVTVVTLTSTGVSAAAQEKSPGKASLLSLLMPGTGEIYAGGPRSARFFLFTEGLFWAGMAVFKSLEGSRTDTYRAFAALHAGVRLEGKPDRFIEEVALNQSIYARNARERYVSGEFANLRPETDDQTWEWDSESSRRQFLTLRSKVTSAENTAFLFIGALVFNRFSSALNAASIARRTRSPAPDRSISLSSGATPDGRARVDLRLAF